jgi:DNA-directed RNA polymerase subunit RPC12/RpoP
MTFICYDLGFKCGLLFNSREERSKHITEAHSGFRIKCLDCGKKFSFNLNGGSDAGVDRPQCPRCFEEIDLEDIKEKL